MEGEGRDKSERKRGWERGWGVRVGGKGLGLGLGREGKSRRRNWGRDVRVGGKGGEGYEWERRRW